MRVSATLMGSLISAEDESGNASLSEGCPQDTLTDVEETESWSPFKDYEELLCSGPSIGDERVSQKRSHPPSHIFNEQASYS